MSKKNNTPTKIYEGQTESNDSIDIHELLKHQVYDEKITPLNKNSYNTGAQSGEWIQQNKPYTGQSFGISDQYLVLDSFLKSPESNLSKGEFMWNLAVQGVTTESPNLTGVLDILSTVIEITIGSFAMPILPDVPYPLPNSIINTAFISNGITLIQNNDTKVTGQTGPTGSPPPNEAPLLDKDQYPKGVINYTPWISNPLSQTPFGNAITIQIKEAGIQSISALDGIRYHFEYIVWYPSYDDGTNPGQTRASAAYTNSNIYIFTEPLIDLQTISLIFRNPTFPIIFDPDIIDCKISMVFNTISYMDKYPYTQYITPISLIENPNPPPNDILPPISLTFHFINHNLLTGDRIYIKNINIGNTIGIPILDTYLTNTAGLLVGDIPDAKGDSLKSKNGLPLSTTFSFCTDPLIQMNTPEGIINNFEYINGIITATVVYKFGFTQISFRYNESTTIPNTGYFTINKLITGFYNILVIDILTLNIEATPSLLQVSTSALVFIAKRRLRIPITFRCVVNKITNFINI